MATVSEIVNRAAGELGILRLGQSLQDQDKTRITAAYDEIYAELKKEGIATWAKAGATPDECVRWVAVLMADNCANNYGVPDKRLARIQKDAAQAKREIRKMVTPSFTSTDDPTDY